MSVDDLIFLGLAGKVLALDRHSGVIVWRWKADGAALSGVPIVLLDGDRVVASLNGYVTALDASTGAPLWHNPLKGEGIGLATMASTRGSSGMAAMISAVAAAASSESS